MLNFSIFMSLFIKRKKKSINELFELVLIFMNMFSDLIRNGK